ncbi:N-6 DNA methylase [Streptomyces sp. NPDC059193]|uniref:N-6 DNA methylase n=1 Tax=Streptomyces sp. NPDC059193 TaxID=3346763 RepID=UPI0036BC9E15
MSSTPLASRVSRAVATALAPEPGPCRDPGCARHAGAHQYPPFPTGRSSGAVFGESVAEAWYRSGGSRLDIPAGIVAALALWPIKTPGAEHADDLANYIAAQPPRVLVRGFAECFASHWNRRPDLMDLAWPLFGWTEEELNPTQLTGVQAVTRAALRHGVLHHTGDMDAAARSHTDLMSWVITNLRHHESRRSMGEYHTPPDISDLMAAMLGVELPAVAGPQGDWFLEATAGTGGLFRSTAQSLRAEGRDPASYGWVMTELDPLAAAGAAVNAVVWGLGPRAVVGCGDALVRADLDRDTLAHQRELVQHRDRLSELIGFAIASHTADRLLRKLIDSR